MPLPMERTDSTTPSSAGLAAAARTPVSDLYPFAPTDRDLLLLLRDRLDRIIVESTDLETLRDLSLNGQKIEAIVSHIRTLEEFFRDAFEPGLRKRAQVRRTFLDGIARDADMEIPFRDLLQVGNARHRYADALRHVLPMRGAARRVLELACGPCPLLASLFREHTDTICGDAPCRGFGRVISYLGVDRRRVHVLESQYRRWGEKLGSCFPIIEFAEADILTEPGIDKVVATATAPFDYISLTFVLHELPPSSWPLVFSRVADLLTEDGEFVLLDFGMRTRFNAELWTYDHFERDPRFWEVGSVWIDFEQACQLVEAAGLSVVRQGPHEGNTDGDWWFVTARRRTGGPSTGERQRALEGVVQGILREQLEQSGDELCEAEGATRARLKELDFDWLSIPLSLRYLALCASQMARRTAYSDLTGVHPWR